jgi:hypothetical protein
MDTLCLLKPSGSTNYFIGDTMEIWSGSIFDETYICDAEKQISFDNGKKFFTMYDIFFDTQSNCQKAMWIIPETISYFDSYSLSIKQQSVESDSCIVRIKEYNGDFTAQSRCCFEICSQ